MGTSRETTERQLQDAKTALAQFTAALKEEGVTGAALKRNPKWRHLDAKARQLSGRLRRIGEIEALNEEVASRKAAKLAGAVEESE